MLWIMVGEKPEYVINGILKHTVVITETVVFKLFIYIYIYIYSSFVKLAYGTVGCLLVA